MPPHLACWALSRYTVMHKAASRCAVLHCLAAQAEMLHQRQ